MMLAADRPCFAPYPGFFQKARLADMLVLLDRVQFPQGTTWVSRNRFKDDGGAFWLTLPVQTKGLGRQLISEVRIAPDERRARKQIEHLRHAYTHAPYFSDHLPLLERPLSSGDEGLADRNVRTIRHLMSALGLPTPIVRLSELGPVGGGGTERLVEICRVLNADAFLVQRSALPHLDAGRFAAAGIRLRSFAPRPPVYPQLWGDFIPDLSAFDLLFNCGPKAHAILLRGLPAEVA
jgi:hypothetical protein